MAARRTPIFLYFFLLDDGLWRVKHFCDPIMKQKLIHSQRTMENKIANLVLLKYSIVVI